MSGTREGDGYGGGDGEGDGGFLRSLYARVLRVGWVPDAILAGSELTK